VKMKQAARQLFAGGISQKMGVTVSDVFGGKRFIAASGMHL